jgi:hypothetical protein
MVSFGAVGKMALSERRIGVVKRGSVLEIVDGRVERERGDFVFGLLEEGRGPDLTNRRASISSFIDDVVFECEVLGVGFIPSSSFFFPPFVDVD